jgi:hypothetical protein
MIVLLVVLAVVLVLVARAWKSVAPTALDVSGVAPAGAVPDHGQPQATEALRKGDLPRMDEARQRTDEHGARVQEALQVSE